MVGESAKSKRRIWIDTGTLLFIFAKKILRFHNTDVKPDELKELLKCNRHRIKYCKSSLLWWIYLRMQDSIIRHALAK